jgi:hypothetical protein
VKTEIDVGIQGWQDLDVEQLPESESWREVGRHQVRGRLEEIWKRHCTKKSHFQIRDCLLQCHHYRGYCSKHSLDISQVIDKV